MNAPTTLSSLLPNLTRVLDADPAETGRMALDAFVALVATEGPERARFILDELARMARAQRTGWVPEAEHALRQYLLRWKSSPPFRATWPLKSGWPH